MLVQVHVKRSVLGAEDAIPSETDKSSHSVKPPKPLVRKSKLVLVDLAGSERVHKSGSEGHMLEEAKSINLSLSALGKCINALAENSAHVPVHDSKLTRLLRDSFGGTARTSLIVTIGPSPRHRGETASTVLFGQRKERLKCQMKYMESVKKLEEKMIENQRKYGCDGFMKDKCNGEGPGFSIAEVKNMLEKEIHMRMEAEEEVNKLKSRLGQSSDPGASGDAEILKLQKALEDEGHQKKKLEEEIIILRSQMLQLSFEADQVDLAMLILVEILQCLNWTAKDLGFARVRRSNVRIHAVKVVANLAAEEANQERIVEAGGLTSLLMLLRSYEDETVRRVAAGAIANLAMNDKLQATLRSEGGIKALLGMVRCGHPDVLSQVARGIANFAKCESRASTNGIKSGRSLLINDGALPWIVQNANNDAAPIRRHIELALCHLAQHEVNAKNMISGGALWELVQISRDCSREDIKSLARRTLNSSPVLRAEMRRLRIEL
ncbi:hypothetical protein CRYUN_Cryun01aG0239500 [Craigia yunnanensis]